MRFLSRCRSFTMINSLPSLSRKAFSTSTFGGSKLRYKQLRRRSTSVRQVSCVADVFEDTFKKEVLESDVPVLIDFWATWCGPCKLIDNTVKQLETEYEGILKVVKVETDKNPNIVEKYKVYGLPTFLLFRDGAVIEKSKKEGAMTKKDLIEYLDNYGISMANINPE